MVAQIHHGSQKLPLIGLSGTQLLVLEKVLSSSHTLAMLHPFLEAPSYFSAPLPLLFPCLEYLQTLPSLRCLP